MEHADDPAGRGRHGTVPLCERYAVADVDSHIIEPADLWTSRVSSKWGDLVPHVTFHERRAGGPLVHRLDRSSTAWAPSPRRAGRSSRRRIPRRLSEALPAAVDAKARLAYMDEVGVYYQLLYPQHPRLPQPRVPQRDGPRDSPPSASGPTTTG